MQHPRQGEEALPLTLPPTQPKCNHCHLPLSKARSSAAHQLTRGRDESPEERAERERADAHEVKLRLRPRRSSLTITCQKEFSNLCSPALSGSSDALRRISMTSSSDPEEDYAEKLNFSAWKSVSHDLDKTPQYLPMNVKEKPPLSSWKSCSALQGERERKPDTFDRATNPRQSWSSTYERRKSVSFDLPTVQQIMTYPPEACCPKCQKGPRKPKSLGSMNKALKKSWNKGIGKLHMPKNSSAKEKPEKPEIKPQNLSPLPFTRKKNVVKPIPPPKKPLTESLSASPMTFLRKKKVELENASSVRSSTGSHLSEHLGKLSNFKVNFQRLRHPAPFEPTLTGFAKDASEFSYSSKNKKAEGDSVSITSFTSIESSASAVKKMKKNKLGGKKLYKMPGVSEQEVKLRPPVKPKSSGPLKAFKTAIGKKSKSTMDLSALDRNPDNALSRSYDDILKENNFPTQEEFMVDVRMLTLSHDYIEPGDFDDDDDYYPYVPRRRSLAEPETRSLTGKDSTSKGSSSSLMSKMEEPKRPVPEKRENPPAKICREERAEKQAEEIAKVEELGNQNTEGGSENVSEPPNKSPLSKRGSVHDIILKYETLERCKSHEKITPPSQIKPPIPPRPRKISKTHSIDGLTATAARPIQRKHKGHSSAEDASWFDRELASLSDSATPSWKDSSWRDSAPWAQDYNTRIKNKGKKPMATPRSSLMPSKEGQMPDEEQRTKGECLATGGSQENEDEKVQSEKGNVVREMDIPCVIVTSEVDDIDENDKQEKQSDDAEQGKSSPIPIQLADLKEYPKEVSSRKSSAEEKYPVKHTLSSSSTEEQGFLSSLHRLVMKTPSLSSGDDQPSLKQRIVKRLSSVSSAEDREALERSLGKSSPRGSGKKIPPKRPPPPKLPLEKLNSYNQYLYIDHTKVPETPPPPKPPRLFQILSGYRKPPESPFLSSVHNYRRFSLVDSDCEIIRSGIYAKQQQSDEISHPDSATDGETDGGETYTKYRLGETTDDESLCDFAVAPEQDDALEMPPESPQPRETDSPARSDDENNDNDPYDEGEKGQGKVVSPFPYFASAPCDMASPQSEYDNVGHDQQSWATSKSEARCIEVILGPESSQNEQQSDKKDANKGTGDCINYPDHADIVTKLSQRRRRSESESSNRSFREERRNSRLLDATASGSSTPAREASKSPSPVPAPRSRPVPSPRSSKPSSAPSSRPTSAMSTTDRPLLAMFFEKLLENHANQGESARLSISANDLDNSQAKAESPRGAPNASKSENDILGDAARSEAARDHRKDPERSTSSPATSATCSDVSSLCESPKCFSKSFVGKRPTVDHGRLETRRCVSENELLEAMSKSARASPTSSNASAPARPHPRPRQRPALTRSNAVISSSDEDFQESSQDADAVVVVPGGRKPPARGVWVRRASDSLLTGARHLDDTGGKKHSLTETGYSGDSEDDEESRPSLTEKERCLVRRNSSLNTQLSRLQLHVKTLSCENNSLKNKMEVELERPLEFREKERHRQREVQVLKKKNSELATITRKLEEKVRSLEKKTKESPSTERRNNFLARQKEKDAMYEKQLLERDREIQRLKARMKELVRKLTGKNGEITRAQSTLELEQIIRTVAKERLQLERHLAVANEGLSRGEADVARLASLEETNSTLKQQLDDLELLTRQHHTLQRHVQEKDLECVTLKEKLKLKNELCQDLDVALQHPEQECQLARVIEKNTELTIQNSDLQKQIQELQHVSEECKTLKHTLTQVETDWSSAKVQVGSLQGKVGTLESVLRLDDVYGLADGPRARGGNSLEAVLIQMKEAADKRRELERQHAEALAQLRERQSAISDTSRYNDKDRKASVEVIEALQSKIRELEKKAEAQNLRHEELLLEMQSLKKAQGSPKNSWSRSGSLSAELQSPDSGDVTPDKNLVNGNIPGVLMPQYETDNRVLDVLEIPGKGRCHVYIARYSYDPFQHSPNENPEAELAVNAGDYVLVWGAMDEVAPRTIDGFFDGELLDGRRGLVPSNFVEKLVGEDLIEFHQSVVMGLRDGDESMSTSVPQDLDFISQDESQLIELAANQTRHNAYTSYIDLEDIIEEEEETLGEHVPPPVQLTLERQLNKSILIGWNPPPDAPPGSIESYHVYVNGLLKTTVRASERTRALVEGVDSTKLHRISVRSVTPNRRTSRDAACTMVIGKDAPLGPTSVKATSITSTSAVISWLPSNSNFQHTVCVNNVEVRTVKPGVYRHTITGLSPNTTYRVTIRAKNLRAPQFDEKATRNQDRLSTTIEFRTLPKGLPDPPVDVQVEPGPQDGSLLVTWLPVTINSTGGTSNGAPVTGYAVYADGKKVTEVESPTGDHALIDLTKIPGFEPKQVTVRTKSRDSVSGDSVPSQIPSHFARGRGRGKLEEDEALLHSDMDRPSELSDIAEESETELSDEDMHADGHKPGPHHGLGGPHHGPPGPHHGPPGGPHHGPTGPGGLRDRLLGRRGAPAPGVRTDHLGQTILEHEDNLSDKEIYPGHQQGQMAPQTSIPAIGPARSGLARLSSSLFNTIGKGVSRARQITKDPASETHPPLEDDYEVSQGGRGRFDPRSAPPRSHLERGRPPPPPHHNRPMMRDPRDPRDVRDPRDPHYRDGRDPRDPRDRRDPHMRDPHAHRDPRDPRDMRDRYEGDGRHRGEYGRDYPGGRGEGRGGGRGGGGQGDQHTRIFVALFDYDPPTMSPNPDACDEELGFREGQLIQVTGDKDPDGFYWGELGGRHGYVPCNMVSEVQVDDDRVAQELLKESDGGRRRRDGSVGRRHQGDRWGDIYANMPVKKMIAMYDYDPQELSPNVDSEVELSFQTGDIIYVYGDMDDDGFYMGELGGHRGLVPSNFLQDAPQDYADDHRSRRDTLDPRDRAPPPGQSGRGPGPGAHGPPPPPRPDQRDRRKGYEGGPGGPGGPPPRPRHHHRGERL
ncbi:microtubule-associated protein futsch-like isoform X3 [Penaeus indicus]|uniref:microtubule-associated protein futsch-like isoform X3 n=1 Tax=Penaeus indicus TaxID=29960 RepID=UPI00300C4E1A